MPRLLLTLAAAALIAPAAPTVAADPAFGPTDWPWWRGPNHDGIAPADQNPPVEWSDTENVVWKAPVPGRGHASPTVVGDQIFLATADESDAVQSVLCYDRATGEKLWQTVVHRGGTVQKQNAKASLASSTIACDGERLFVNFLHDGAVHTTALNRDGERLWQTKITEYVVHQGYGSSPTVYKSLVIVSADNKGGGAIAGLDRETGRVVWRQDRPETPNYVSPIVLTVDGKDRMVFSGCEQVTCLDPMTGEKLWEHPGSTTETVTSAVTDGEHVFISGGYPKQHVAAVRLDGSGEVAWEVPIRVYVPSMFVKDGHLYAVSDNGIALCWECATGKPAWSERLGGAFTASPVLVGDRAYAINEAGKTFVYRVSPEGFTPVAENQLGRDAFATPTIVGGRIYARVGTQGDGGRQEMLYCIGQKE